MNACLLLLAMTSQPCGGNADRDVYVAAVHANSGMIPQALAELRKVESAHPYNANAAEGVILLRQVVAQSMPPKVAGVLGPEPRYYPNWAFSRKLVTSGIVSWWLALAAVTRWWQSRNSRWLIVAGLMLPLAAVPAANEAVTLMRRECDRAAPPVVVVHEIELREGNGAEYRSKIHLPPGVECRRTGRRGPWVRVEFASGLTGWLPQADVINAFSQANP